MNLKLWRSLYPYNGEFPGSLSFKENEYFLVLRKENEYWFLVSEKKGTLGCVPINYLQESEVSHRKLLKFADKAIGSLSQKTASVISKRDEILRELIELKIDGTDKVDGTNAINNITTSPKVPSLIPDGLAFTLTASIRQTTNASHACSIETLQSLLDILKCNIPDLKMWTDAIQNQLLNESKYNLEELFFNSPDWKILTELFNFFQQCKNDSQERSWSLHETVTDLKAKLTKLLETLKMSHRNLVINFLQTHSYEPLLSLIEWYQMEQRIVLRRLLLRIFLVCCEISQQSILICLQSILPLELVRDLTDINLDSKNFTFAALLLTILINNCDNMNIDLQDKLNADFCVALLLKLSDFHNDILNSCKSDVNDADDEYNNTDNGDMNKLNDEDSYYIDDVVVGFLLTYNRQQKDIKSNPVITSLQLKPEYSRLFIEKLIRAFNRNDDPSHFESSNKCEVNSVRKLLCDIFSSKLLSDIIYRNDADVIIDVISRELSDLPTDSSELSEYLMLLDLIVTNSDYLERGKYKSASLIRQLNLLKSVSIDEINKFDQILSASIMEKLII